MTDRRPTCGFTIIEVLVVISIIILLIAMLLPTYRRARDHVKTVICKSKIKQLYTACEGYAADHSGLIPSSRNWVIWGWDDINNVIDNKLWEYVDENKDAYVCPTFRQIYREWPGNENKEVAYSYSMNEYFGYTHTWHGFHYVRFEEIRNPSGLLFMTDENAWINPLYATHAINNGALGLGRHNDPGNKIDGIGSFHDPQGPDPYMDGKSNVVFADGHADLVPPDQDKEVGTPSPLK